MDVILNEKVFSRYIFTMFSNTLRMMEEVLEIKKVLEKYIHNVGKTSLAPYILNR